ncbi:SCO5555 family protein [Herbidospora sp. RD11066]
MAAEDGLTVPEAELARRLRDTQRRVRDLPVTGEERERLARRLLAICDVAKRDIPHAITRLDALIAFLDGEFDTPSSGEFT